MIVYTTDLYAFSFIRVIFRTGYSRGINLRTFQRYPGNLYFWLVHNETIYRRSTPKGLFQRRGCTPRNRFTEKFILRSLCSKMSNAL